jgi:hypothetical protein
MTCDPFKGVLGKTRGMWELCNLSECDAAWQHMALPQNNELREQ